MDKNELIKYIEESFANVTRKGGVSLREAVLMDDYPTQEKRIQIRSLDKDKHWNEIDEDLLFKSEMALCYFDSISFKYHIPAFMVASLRNPIVFWGIIDDLIYALDVKGSNHCRENVSLLNHNQLRCVALFVQIFSEDVGLGHDYLFGKKIYESYWKSFI